MYRSFRLRAFLTSFTSAFLIFLIVWMAALLMIRPVAPAPSSTALQSSSSVYLPDSSDCMTLLLCEDSPSPSVYLLLRFQPVVGNIFIFPFPQKLVLSLNQVSEPASQIYRSFGINGICQALSQTYPIKVEHYIKLSKEALVPLLDELGSTKIFLEKDFPMDIYNTSVILKKGLQVLDGAKMMQWLLKETPSNFSEQGKFLSKVLADCINQHLSLLEESNSQELFSAVVNSCQTNLTFSDYDARRKAADFLSQIAKDPARPLLPTFIQNEDATLSLSPESLSEFQSAFAENQ